jgi:hypothetical protein
MYCGCTEDRACLVINLAHGGRGIPCSWLDLKRTVCTAPDCVLKYQVEQSRHYAVARRKGGRA